MVDRNDVVQAFKEKFSKMSSTEREAYLKKMGFSFEEEIVPVKKASTVRKKRPVYSQKIAATKHSTLVSKKKLSSEKVGMVRTLKVNE